jgi:hypothetical protein
MFYLNFIGLFLVSIAIAQDPGSTCTGTTAFCDAGANGQTNILLQCTSGYLEAVDCNAELSGSTYGAVCTATSTSSGDATCVALSSAPVAQSSSTFVEIIGDATTTFINVIALSTAPASSGTTTVQTTVGVTATDSNGGLTGVTIGIVTSTFPAIVDGATASVLETLAVVVNPTTTFVETLGQVAASTAVDSSDAGGGTSDSVVQVTSTGQDGTATSTGVTVYTGMAVALSPTGSMGLLAGLCAAVAVLL